MNIPMAKKMARNGRTKVIYKETFVSIQTLQGQWKKKYDVIKRMIA